MKSISSIADRYKAPSVCSLSYTTQSYQPGLRLLSAHMWLKVAGRHASGTLQVL